MRVFSYEHCQIGTVLGFTKKGEYIVLFPHGMETCLHVSLVFLRELRYGYHRMGTPFNGVD